MSDFKPGELIDVTIRGLRIESIDDVGIAQCSMPDHAWRPTVNLRVENVDIYRVAPKEWPPRHGDLWHDANGVLWAGMGVDLEDDEPYVAMVPLSPSMRRGSSYDPGDVLRDFGPVTLQHRLPTSDGV